MARKRVTAPYDTPDFPIVNVIGIEYCAGMQQLGARNDAQHCRIFGRQPVFRFSAMLAEIYSLAMATARPGNNIAQIQPKLK